jgi:hypothetical protein
MSDGKHCPACGKDIGLWAVLSAGLPTRVRCPHCKARLSYSGGRGLVINLFVVLLAAGVAAFYFARQLYAVTRPQFYLALIILALAIMLPIDLVATLGLRRRGVLKKVE